MKRNFGGARYYAVSHDDKCILEHRLAAWRALGRPLPKGVEVHHVNGKTRDNRNENLVICPDSRYHKLLHRRQAALEACGNANYRKCHFCKEYDNPDVMYVNDRQSYHRECHNRWKLSRSK